MLLDVEAEAGEADYAELGLVEPSDDGRLLAYSLDLVGDEVYELRFRDLVTGRDLPDRIPRSYYGGAWTANACQKIVRFVDLAETFHMPIVHMVDCPGFLIGLEAERTATIRHGVRAMAAVNQTTVPWCTIIVRNAFGVAGVVHQPANRFSMRYAWPSAYWGSLPLEGGIEAAFKAELEAHPDPETRLAEIRAWALMGMAITLGERFGIWEGEADLDRIVEEVFDMLERGLKP